MREPARTNKAGMYLVLAVLMATVRTHMKYIHENERFKRSFLNSFLDNVHSRSFEDFNCS